MSKINLRLSLLVLSVAFLCLSTSARADTIYQVGGGFTCPNSSCLGGAYTLSFVGANSGTTFDVTLTATTPNTTSGSPAFGDYITSVEFGDGKSIASAQLTSAPGGTSAWGNTVYGNLSNAGCTSGNAPNACNNQYLVNSLYTLAKANGSTYSWTWHVVFSAAGLDLNQNEMHIGLQYENGINTSNGLIVSESGISNRVSEPSALVLLVTGFVGAGVWRRRNALGSAS
ncbi:MAG TPA: PEP-CTERM sorting domain-containing protein [Terriglobales bacterium]|nr:PEP-CTERM sorting domain-containing protein [Terriglobales bacterium]